MRKHILLVLTSLLIHAMQAQQKPASPVLTARDSVIMTLDEANRMFVTHTVRAGQSLYSIGKFFGVPVERILFYNPGKKAGALSIGDKLTIPLRKRAIIRFRRKNFNKKKYAPLFYRVRKGDTAYGIAKRIFKMPVDSLMARNRSLKNGIHPGQLLHVGWISLNGVKNTKGPGGVRPRHPLAGEVYRERMRFMKDTINGRKIYQQRGIAYWPKDNVQNGSLYALHRHAKIGSVIKVTNPMTGITLYARVVGRFQPRKMPAGTKVVLSPAAAGYLGAIDPKFYTEIEYYR